MQGQVLCQHLGVPAISTGDMLRAAKAGGAPLGQKAPGPDRMAAVLKTPGEIDLMDRANRIVHQVLDAVGERMVPGVKTCELDRLAERIIRDAGGVPAFLRYRGYPATLCISVNDVIVHGIPGENPLQEGDIVGIDCGVFYKGYCGDAARTFAVGRASDAAKRLLRVTEG